MISLPQIKKPRRRSFLFQVFTSAIAGRSEIQTQRAQGHRVPCLLLQIGDRLSGEAPLVVGWGAEAQRTRMRTAWPGQRALLLKQG